MARSKAPRSYKGTVPQEALDECQKSYVAADEKKEKTHGEKFDDTGLMALVCRHDVVLFLVNVDTPGEQQKYAVTLIEHLFDHIPSNATVAAFYDVGCILDRSLKLVSPLLLPRLYGRLSRYSICSMIFSLTQSLSDFCWLLP